MSISGIRFGQFIAQRPRVLIAPVQTPTNNAARQANATKIAAQQAVQARQIKPIPQPKPFEKPPVVTTLPPIAKEALSTPLPFTPKPVAEASATPLIEILPKPEGGPVETPVVYYQGDPLPPRRFGQGVGGGTLNTDPAVQRGNTKVISSGDTRPVSLPPVDVFA